ncbi:alpha/beta hydrolase [Nocardia stercoris]|uniref:Alpha/beta hydrolase n=1 Tax=Nocardia stercoris TaxID=2483361 RepID=A0A3M2KQR7_9NOCA|nr:alpha/beta hydrolase [Nocardia stercoris]RMI27972.1 alpha/beta hydrolase [Nocardia stercoris]
MTAAAGRPPEQDEEDVVATLTDSGEFDGRGGRVSWQAWLPDGTVRAVVVLVHGVAEHAGRYAHVAEHLVSHGFAVFAPDHIGHGKSGGRRANVESLDGAADNVATVLDLAGSRYPGVPRFLVAHSLGSLITLHLATRAPLDVAGIAVSAPPLLFHGGSALQRRLAPMLSKLIPNIGIVQLDSAEISRDPEVVAAYDADPLVFRGKLPIRTGAEMLATSELVVRRLDQLTVPTLVLHGEGDVMADPASADLIERWAASQDLTVIRYPGLYHEVFNEPEQEKVLGDLTGWLENHLAGQ